MLAGMTPRLSTLGKRETKELSKRREKLFRKDGFGATEEKLGLITTFNVRNTEASEWESGVWWTGKAGCHQHNIAN